MIIVFFSKITHIIPGSMIAILFATVTVQIFHLPVGNGDRADKKDDHSFSFY
ncbi:MAG: hypothetical protein ABIQ07_09350 [Ginsengibacter sp.]